MAKLSTKKLLYFLCLTFTLAGLVNILAIFQVRAEKRPSCPNERKSRGRQLDSVHRENESIALGFKPLNLEYENEESKPDEWNNTGAIEFLKTYNKELNKNVQPISADPYNVSTITEWWQAAAMIHWYFNSSLRYTCPEPLKKFADYLLCQVAERTVRQSCVVYSFGVKRDFWFDDAGGWTGCEVWSFDPGLNLTDHLRGKRVHFYNLGLSTTNTDIFLRTNQAAKKWKMRTFRAIQQMIGHKNQPLDIVKLNIGGEEWSVLDYLMENDLLKSMRYLMVHFHLSPSWPAKENYVNSFKTVTRLRQLGFREYHSRVDSVILDAKNFTLRATVLYLNAKFNWFF
ncbi:unnamed protein product [Lymnaea stagnalis]|uniref:Methyltransferase domain-containing protein n=1 Tax=Lymnaea stagnalis TaxID=6523 RepID=A0AAV2H763_LYMST